MTTPQLDTTAGRATRLSRSLVALALAALPIASLAGMVRAQHSGSAAAPAKRAQLEFGVSFQGVGAEGTDDIWRGPLRGSTAGEITIRVEYRGRPIDAAQPVWPVRVFAFVAHDDPSRSFLAEEEGTLDWTTGTLELSGRVTEGWMKDALVEQTVRLDRSQFDGAGVLRLELSTASSDR
jgi:hypothetical protein